MSKKHLSQRGWISFTGLRHAKQFATREEIVREIRGFFDRRGVADFDKVQVEFVEDGAESSSVQGDYVDHGTRGWIRIFIRKSQSVRDFWSTLFHELDHHWWNIQGQAFDYSSSYRQRPHERRAYRVGSRQATRVMSKVA